MRHRPRGQAAIEVVAAVPLLVLAGLLAWQLAALLVAGMRAEQDVRARAIAATGPSGGVVVVAASVRVPQVLPGVRGLSVPARAGIRIP